MPNKKKICYILSNIDKALAFEWIANGLKDSLQLSFVLIGRPNSHLSAFLKQQSIPYIEVPYMGKKDLPKALIQVYRHLRMVKPDVVHTHLFEANIIGLTAAWLAGIKQRIYTRHHSDYHFIYAPSGIKYDRWCNYLATKIVAISKNVRNILIEREQVSPDKLVSIYHGFDLPSFEYPDFQKVSALKNKYNPKGKGPVIGVIGRQTHLKGIQYIIPAFTGLLKDYPNALIILANAQGDFKSEIDRLLTELIPPENRCSILFENDLTSLYQLFDVYVHVPVSETVEAFGQTYIEVLAAGIPSVFTLSGVAPEFIVDEKNALVVPFCNADSILIAINRLLTDTKLRQQLTTQGKLDVKKMFGLETMMEELTKLYQ